MQQIQRKTTLVLVRNVECNISVIGKKWNAQNVRGVMSHRWLVQFGGADILFLPSGKVARMLSMERLIRICNE
jgi:hypothetical protein